MTNRRKISVCMLAYNHAGFIAQAIQSVLMQEVEADVELVIGNDKSTDNTAEIINQFVQRYPNKIIFIDRRQNVGMMNNFIDVLSHCDGDFIAICEGDDYWINSNKLQMQMDVLDGDSKAIISFTDLSVASFTDVSILKEYYSSKVKEKIYLQDLYNFNPIATCSVLFKNILDNQILDNLKKFLIGDWPLYMLLLNKSNGVAIYTPIKTCVYRKHESGNFSTLSIIEKLKIDSSLFEELLKIESFKSDSILLKKCFSKSNYAIGIREGSKKVRRQYFNKAISQFSYNNINYPVKSLVKKVLDLFNFSIA
jgi:glycosyltransferase involved in cell wall biosynthesis